MKIFVGNLPFSYTDTDLAELFAEYGPVTEATLVADRFTGRPKGYGFVQMSRENGEVAIYDLNGNAVSGRKLQVEEARGRRT